MKNTTNKIVVLSGPSGAGKTSIVNELTKTIYIDNDRDLHCTRVISYTTRQPRGAETHGIDYNFISVERFNEIENAAGFLECATVFGNKYGTPKITESNVIHIFTIDPQGAYNIQQTYPETLTIFIHPPSKQELHTRLTQRNQDSDDTIQKRMSEYEIYLEHSSKYQFQVMNIMLKDTIQNITQIICNQYNVQVKS